MDKKVKALYALAWIIPVLVFTSVLGARIQPLLEVEAEYRFVEDQAYIGLAAARSYADSSVYGLSIYDAMPATRDALWHAFQIGASLITPHAPQLVLVLNYLLMVLAIYITYRFARRWCPGPLSTLAATLLFALLPCTTLSAMQGTSQALLLMLGAGACAAHFKGLHGRNTPLSMRTALLVGLAAMVHVEAVALWLIFGIHALVAAPFLRQKGALATAAFQFVSGVFVIAACMWPLVHWNILTMQVPWPTSMDASLTVNVAAQGLSGEGLNSLIELSDDPSLKNALGAMFGVVILGALALLASSVKEVRFRFLVPGLLFPWLLSMSTGGMSVLTGKGGVGQVELLLVPALVVLAVVGISSLPKFIEGVTLPGPLTVLDASRVLGLVCLLIVSSMLLGSGKRAQQTLLGQVHLAVDEREQWNDFAQRHEQASPLATDRPGWAAYQHHLQVIDLNGRCTWQILSCLDITGGIDPEMYRDFLRRKKPRYFVAWGPRGKELSKLMVEQLGRQAEALPFNNVSAQAHRVNW